MLKNSDYIRSRLILSYHPTTSGKLERTKKPLKLDTRHASKSKNIQTKVHIQKARYIFISLFLPHIHKNLNFAYVVHLSPNFLYSENYQKFKKRASTIRIEVSREKT